MDKRKDPSSVDIKAVLLDMRKYRMGLIQTPDQLRFSYRAVLEGAKYIMGDCSVQPPSKCPLEKYNGSRVSLGKEGGDAELGERTTGTESPYKEQDVDESTANARKRPRDERVSNWTPKITDPKQTKPSITDSEKKRKR
nr:tyrosine-protein phosphatase non-receptor type 2-like isoform X2 [Oncorhynchus nerka]